jgi:DNA repair exonuclease SbcCD ATPase subunit
MVIFEKLTYQNFLSTGNKPTVIDLNEVSLTLVIGKNGGGKSTMLDALSFVLFNKPHRAINRPQLINSINDKNCLVTIEFRIGATQYKIVRGIKPNIFEIYQDGQVINQESNSRDYQKLLETNILKLNHKSFHQVVVLGSSNFIPFMQLTSYQRRGVIEDLLDIGMFTKMNVLLKESTAKQKDLIKDTEHNLNLVNEKIKLQSAHLLELQLIDERNSQKLTAELEELQTSISAISKARQKLDDEYKGLFPNKKKSLDENQKKLNKLLSFEHSIKSNIGKIVEDAKFYDHNSTCPSCSQIITEETKSEKIHDCQEKAKELTTGYESLKESLTDVKTTISSLASDIEELNKMLIKIASYNNVISLANERITTINVQTGLKVESGSVETASTNLTSLRESRLNLAELRMDQIEEKTYSDVIAELLKDTGIKTKIIKQYLPIMNKLINQYLQILDFFVSFHLDESFNETIKSRHRDDFSYASFSEGEKARIDLALLFAWRQIAKMKNSASTNLLILDEVMDGSVDGDGIDCFMQILSTLDSDTRTFIISHKQEYTENKFERCLKFDKVNNFSSCEVL